MAWTSHSSTARKTSAILLLVVSVTLSFCACGGDDDDPAPAGTGADQKTPPDLAFTFPEGFLFGTATAGFQVDMGCPALPDSVCVDPNSDWYAFVTSPDMQRRPANQLAGQDPAVVGPGHWELYEHDFDIAKYELNNNAFRMSIEWSRIFPEPTFGVTDPEALAAMADASAVAHYHEVFAALKERGITPLVTLNHYSLPLWIHDGVACRINQGNCEARGWVDRDAIVPEIAKYAGFAAREFGGEVDLWATLNEPMAVLFAGYLIPSGDRTNPPALFLRYEDFRTALVAMIEGHARMYDAVKAADTIDADADGAASQVGIVYAMTPAVPADPGSALDRQAADNVFYLWNMAFLNGALGGVVDEDLDGIGETRGDLAGRADFLGLNYYARMNVQGLPFSLMPELSPLVTVNPLSLTEVEVYPRGIYEMAKLIQERFGLPIHVTENNGQNTAWGDMEAETAATVRHLQWVAAAIADGVDIRGYFYWSLMDNYEWNHGMEDAWGLYAVDPDDPFKTRVPRVTAGIYAAIAGARGVPQDLAALYPIDFSQ